jgi:hypothetical protein
MSSLQQKNSSFRENENLSQFPFLLLFPSCVAIPSRLIASRTRWYPHTIRTRKRRVITLKGESPTRRI